MGEPFPQGYKHLMGNESLVKCGGGFLLAISLQLYKIVLALISRLNCK